MAHGGTPEWDAAVVEAVVPLKSQIPTALALGMADPATMQAALDSLENQGVDHVAVVRLFLSGESFLHDTEYYLKLRPDAPEMPMALMMAQMMGNGAGASHGAAGTAVAAAAAHGASAAAGSGATQAADESHGATMSHGAAMSRGMAADNAGAEITIAPLDFSAKILLEMRGLSESPIAASIVADRTAAVSTDPARESVIIVAHGMGDEGANQRVLDNMQASVELLEARGFKEVRAATLREDWPEERVKAEADIRAWVGARAERGDRVIVVPFRLFGFGGYAEILDGIEYTPADGLLPHPLVSDWIEDSASTMFCAEGVANPFGSCTSAR